MDTIRISTQVFEDGQIEQTVEERDSVQNIAERIHRYVLDTQDAQIRRALIDLGWIPPDRNEESW